MSQKFKKSFFPLVNIEKQINLQVLCKFTLRVENSKLQHK